LQIPSQFPAEILDRIEESAVIAVLVIDEAAHAVPAARALLAGGIGAMELTLRTPAALDALAAIREEVPDMLAGIGTILTPGQVDEVLAAGAAFGVSPGLNPEVVTHARQAGFPFAPGVATPGELEKAIALGCREVKLFPAEAMGGLDYLKSFGAPYRHLGIRYIPLGGLNAGNMADYLREPSVLALGGSWLAKQNVIQRNDWETIRQNAAEARIRADQIRTRPES